METMTEKLALLKDSIRGLEGSDLDKLVDYCLAQKQVAVTSPTRDRASYLFYRAMEFELRKIGHRLPPLHKFLSLKVGKEYPTQVRKVEDFLEGLMDRKVDTWDRLTAYRLLVELMAEDIKQMNIPLGPKTLLEAIDRLPSVFEDAFPGYVVSGLAWKVLQK